MSKTWISVLVVAVVLVGGYFALSGKKPASDMGASGTSAEHETTAPQTSDKKVPFSDYISKGGSFKCTVTQNVNNTQTQGTTYINNGMVRGEYNMKIQGMDVNSTMIVRDGYVYSWSSMMGSSGFKTKVAATTPNTTAPATGSYGWNADQIGDYSCDPWTVDASKFTIPTNITFKLMGSAE